MNFIDKMVERFLKLNRKMKRWQRAVSVMAAVVVFVTTYALVLPAITLDKDTATTQAGIEIAASENEADEAGTVFESEQEDAVAEEEPEEAEEPATEEDTEEAVVEEPSEEEDSSSESGSQDAETVEAEADETEAAEAEAVDEADASKTEPAAEIEQTDAQTGEEAAANGTTEEAIAAATNQTAEEVKLITEDTRLTYEGSDYFVYADFGESAQLPEGVQLKVKEITKESDPEAYEAYYQKALSEMQDKYDENTTLSFAKFYDISFVYEGAEIEPSGNVTVRIEYKKAVEIKESTTVDTIHFDKNDDEKAEVIDSDTEGTEKQVEAVEFKSDQFSVYGVIGASLETEFTISNADGEDVTYLVKVTYGPEAKIPEGSTLRVTSIADGTEAYQNARNAVLADKKEKEEIVDINDFNLAALDISIIDPNGQEIEPEAAVTVEIKIKDLPGVENLDEVKETLEIQHHVEVSNGVVVEKVFDGSVEGSYKMDTDENIAKNGTAVDPNSVSEEDFQIVNNGEDEAIDASFDTEVFSTFTITWRDNQRRVTVHYVDGNGNELTIDNPDNTHPDLTANSSSPAFLIYDIDGYEYDYTYRNTNTNANRIAPMLTKSGQNRWQYMGANNTNTTELSNNDNIYVVYKKKTDPTTGGTPSVDTDEQWPDQEDPARKPQFGKSSTNNGNGTNKISLTIEAPEKPVEKQTPADVIVVFDRSGSMNNNMDGQTRIARAKTATNTMANTLLSNNSDVRMALISFSTTATVTQGFTTSLSTFQNSVNSLTPEGGTNWEQALQLANTMDVRPDAATFVVFVTDGDPTFRISRGDVTNATLNSETYNSGTTYQYYRNNHVFGQGNADSAGHNFDFAVDQVSAIAGATKNFYAIGISNDVTKVQNLTTQGGVAADHAFIASDSAAMEAAFKSITESIKSVLGFGDVEITDGITALTNAEMKVMQSVDPNSFTYYRYGGENNKYGDGYANKTEWTSRAADGCAAATYNESDGAVHWDMGEGFQLEDDVTYIVEFTVWPSQAAYDLVADLNNGLKTFDSLTPEEKAQVVEVTAPTETTTGTYALKTNTDQVNATYSQTSKSGDVVTVSGETDLTAEYIEGTIQNMSLDSDFITVKKEWHNALDSRVVDGITLTVTKDGTVYLDDVALSDENGWTSDNQYISTGFITTTSDGRYNVREIGHEYTVTEPEAFSYYWDLTADTYRPMVIDGTLHMLIKTDNPTGTEGTDYYVIEGNKYQASETTTPMLTARNDRRSNLNLKKLVTANTDAVDKVPDPDDVFTYTITITDANGDAVWFSAMDENEETVLIPAYSPNVTPELGEDDQPTGSYSVPSGEQFTISIKADWNVRFFNLPTGTTYSIQETDMADGYEFVKAETSAEVTDPAYADAYKATPGTVSGNTVTGTIDQPNNVFSTEYTNNWNPKNEIVIIKTDENGGKLAGATFKLSKMADDGWKEIATFNSKADAGETLKVGHGLYKLEETAAPADYYSRVETVYFTVVTNGNTTTVVLADEEGEEIEEDVSSVYPDVTVNGNEISVKNWPLTTADAQKKWKNADGTTTAPDGATVVFTLYADEEKTEYTVTLDGAADEAPTGADPVGYESVGWTATFVNLPKYNLDGEAPEEIEYTIAETTTYPGYTVSTTDPVASGETITNTQVPTTANALKAWKNADGSTTPPDGATVVFTLYADGTATDYTVTLDGNVDSAPTGTGGYESESWKAEFINLPMYQQGTTTEIVYTIAETITYPGYTASTTDPVASGETITNEQGATETFALKAWKNADGTTEAPEGGTVVFTLYADGTATSYTVTLDGTVDPAPTGTGGYESEAWKAAFVKLPKYKEGTTTEIVYTIAETTTYPGYTASTTDPVASGSTITNSQDPTVADATKAWKNADGSTTAPQGGKVTFTLYADGTATSYTVTLDGTADTAPTVTGGYESEAWKATFVNLPKYKAGTTTEIEYTIAETGTYPGYTASTTEPVASGGTITNTQEPTEADATKAWKNADGSTTPPEGATVEFTLYADGTATDYKVTLDGTVDTAPTGTGGYESEAWKASFVKLPKYKVVDEAPVDIVYTIKETITYPGYTPDPEGEVASGGTITNKQVPTEAEATKAWLNADSTTTPPEGATVVFTLYADGEETEFAVTLDGTADGDAPTVTAGYESEAWIATFVNLPKFKADGTTEIVYTIKETEGYEGYEMDPTTAVESGGTITNKQISTVIEIKKIGDWTVDNPLSDVQFKLYSDAECSNQITVDGKGDPIGTDGTITTGSDGTARVGALVAGTYYLKETANAPGYELLGDPIEFTIKADGSIEYSIDNQDFEVQNGAYYELEDGVIGIYINNPSGAALPNAGGSGTLLYTLGGLMLILASAMMYGFRMRRGERRFH